GSGLRRGSSGGDGRCGGDRGVEALAALRHVVVAGEADDERTDLLARLVEQFLLDVEVDLADLLGGRRGRFDDSGRRLFDFETRLGLERRLRLWFWYQQ